MKGVRSTNLFFFAPHVLGFWDHLVGVLVFLSISRLLIGPHPSACIRHKQGWFWVPPWLFVGDTTATISWTYYPKLLYPLH